MSKLPSRTALAVALTVALAGMSPAWSADTVVASAPSIDAIDAARGDARLIILRAGVFDPATQQLDARDVGASASVASTYALVQFRAGQLGARKALAQRGVEFLGYVPNNAYYVRLNGVPLAELTGNAAVRWAGNVQPAMKLDPALWSARNCTSA
jgi:hypothetical protein